MSKVVDKVVDSAELSTTTKTDRIGKRLADAREALGLTQEALAKAAGVSKRGVQENEAHDRVPGGKIVPTLISMGVNANWLLSGEGEMLLDHGAQSSPGQPQASQSQYMVSESAPRPEAAAGVDSAFMRLCLGACVMVHGEPFARESTALQVEYACDLYNHLAKQAATRPEGIKAGMAAISRLETRGVADQLRLLLQLGWARAYNNSAPPKNGPPGTTVP